MGGTTQLFDKSHSVTESTLLSRGVSKGTRRRGNRLGARGACQSGVAQPLARPRACAPRNASAAPRRTRSFSQHLWGSLRRPATRRLSTGHGPCASDARAEGSGFWDWPAAQRTPARGPRPASRRTAESPPPTGAAAARAQPRQASLPGTGRPTPERHAAPSQRHGAQPPAQSAPRRARHRAPPQPHPPQR